MRSIHVLALTAATAAAAATSGIGCSGVEDAQGVAEGATAALFDQVRGDPRPRIEGVATQVNLISDLPNVATTTDGDLLNAWGLAFNPSGPAWISANGNGTANVYDSTGTRLLEVTVPVGKNQKPPSAPTGQIFNKQASSAFMGDLFIIVSEDGVVSGWQPGFDGNAMRRADSSPAGAVYKGVAIATTFLGQTQLYAADFHNANIDVFDASYVPVAMPRGAFRDPRLPAGYAPFNVFGVGTFLFVSYAQQDDKRHDDVPGAGHGFVDLFTADGFFVQRLISRGALNSPWGMVFAPDRDNASIDLLVGNFGDGKIDVYDLSLRGISIDVDFEGALGDPSGKPIVIDGLWALVFGPGAGGFPADQLFFTAGPNGEADGLFGKLIFGQRR